MQSTPRPLQPRAAAGAMIASMALIGAIDNVVPLMSEHVSLWQFHTLRALMTLPMLFLIVLLAGSHIRARRLWAVALRSVLIALAMLCYFGSLGFLSIAQALAGLFTSPIFVLLISACMFNQRVGPWRIAAVAIGFVGVLLVLRPWDGGFQPLVLVPMLGGALYAMGSVLTRQICGEESTHTLLTGIFTAQLLFGTAALILLPSGSIDESADFIAVGWAHDFWPATGYILLQAVGSLVGVGLLVWGYQHGEASKITVFEYSVLFWGPLIGWLFFDQPIGAVGVFGIMLIFTAGAVIALRSEGDHA